MLQYMDSITKQIARLALTAVLYEASAAPKPGLVDPFSSGAHSDMDYFTFLASAASIAPWLERFAKLGYLHKGEPESLLPVLRKEGKHAENAMFHATRGVNTHKGLIFSLGLVCAAAGYLYAGKNANSLYSVHSLPSLCASEICQTASAIAKGIIERDFASLDCAANNITALSNANLTIGEKLFLAYKVRGIRGEAEDGFPSVLKFGLPTLRAKLAVGFSWNDALIDTLLVLFSHVEDTNVLGRAGYDGLAYLRSEAKTAIQLGGVANEKGRNAIRNMDAKFIERNISPGGCADMLAVTVFLQLIEREI